MCSRKDTANIKQIKLEEQIYDGKFLMLVSGGKWEGRRRNDSLDLLPERRKTYGKNTSTQMSILGV